MSNQQVGPVFERVIQEVCNSSQLDFEEGGVDQQTLEDLRKGWQKKLSSLGVAHFPWDPAPQPPPPPPQTQHQSQQSPIPPPPVTVPSNAPRTSPPSQHISQPAPAIHGQQALSLPSQTPTPTPKTEPDEVRVKTEPGLPPMGTLPPMSATTLAQQRAANALQQRYGAAAANQISQLQAQSQAALSLPGQQKYQLPDQKPASQPQNQHQVPPQAQQSTIRNGQTDGPGDADALAEWKAEVERRRKAAAKNLGAGDRLIRGHVAARALQMEGNGLMVPLSEHPGFAKGKKRKASASKKQAALLGPTPSSECEASDTRTSPAVAQYDGVDGGDGADEDDDDAINSDLDDPEDLVDETNDGEDAVGQVMLCTYDKVQRIKSKWKCYLKDGILTSGGKEYVFHKGQGELDFI